MENTLLNLIPAAYLPEIHLSQYDVGRTITFTLKDGASDYSVPSGASVKVKATKPSGFGFEVACTFNGGTVTLVTTDTMTPENGRFPAELSITSGSTVIGTSNFIFNIERSPHPEGTIDGDAESILPELTLLVKRIEAAAEQVDEDTQTVIEAKAEVLSAKAETLQAKTDTLSARDESVSAKNLAVSSAETSVEASERAEQLVGSVETKADAIVKTASGEIASFTDGGDDLPMKSLLVNIVPKQSGSGDPSPSNIRSISGTDTVKISRMGNGLFFPTQSVSQTINGITIVSSGGAFHIYGTATSQAISNIFSVNPLTFPSDSAYKVYLGNTVDDSNVEVSFMNGATRIDYWICSGVNRDISMPQSAMSGQTCDGLRFKIASGAIVDLYVAPYIAKAGDIEETSISLGQTVYGGTLEAIEGNGTKTYWYKEFVGDESSVQGLGDYWGWVGDSIVTPWGEGTSPQDGVCSHFKYGVDTLTGVNASSGYYFLIKKSALPSISTLEEFKSWVASQRTNGTPLTVCYKLATPRETFSTTPTQVKTLLGNNNIFADSGSVEVEYRADTTLAYNELLSLIASLS